MTIAFLSVTIALAITILVVIIAVIGLTRWSRRVGRVRRGRVRVAAERPVFPVPAIRALWRRGVAGWLLVRSTATEPVVPRPVTGTVLARGWLRSRGWSPLGKAAAFTGPLEIVRSTVVVVAAAPASENEGKGQSQEKDASNE